MTQSPSAPISALVPGVLADTAFASALDLYVGQGRRYTYKQLARATGITVGRLESFMVPVTSPKHRQPKLSDVLSLCKFLGPEFTSDVLGPSGQAAFRLPDPDDKPLKRIAPDVAKDAADVTQAAVGDNVVDFHGVGSRMMRHGAAIRSLACQKQGRLFG